MSDETDLLLVGDDEVSLLDLAGIDFDALKERRFENLPVGRYLFQVAEQKMEPVDQEIEVNGVKKKVKRLRVTVSLEVVECYVVIGDENPDGMPGKKHSQGWLVKNLEDLERVKAFIVDTGVDTQGAKSLQDALARLPGGKFTAGIRHTKNKDNADIVYANLDKIKAYTNNLAA